MTLENITTASSLLLLYPTSISLKLELPSNFDIPLWFTVTFASINGGGFCLNIISLWLLLTRRFVYRGKVNVFVISLCVSDLIVSMSSFYFLTRITANDVDIFSRRVASIIFSFALEMSLVSLCCLSYERLIAVHKPFRYQEILSTKRVTIMLTFGWTFSFCLLAMQFLFAFIYRQEKYIYFNWVVFVALSTTSIVFLGLVYIYLIYEIHRHSTHIKSCTIPAMIKNSLNNISARCDQIAETVVTIDNKYQTKILPTTQFIQNACEMRNGCDKISSEGDCHILHAVLSSAQTPCTEKRRLAARNQLIRKERRSVLLCVSIVTVFAATWLPVTVFFIRCLISQSCEGDDPLLFICSCLVSLNSFLDPVLYFIIKREFRDFLNGKIFRKKCSRRRRESGESKRGSSSFFL